MEGGGSNLDRIYKAVPGLDDILCKGAGGVGSDATQQQGGAGRRIGSDATLKRMLETIDVPPPLASPLDLPNSPTMRALEKLTGVAPPALSSPSSSKKIRRPLDTQGAEEGFWSMRRLMELMKQRGGARCNAIVPTWGCSVEGSRACLMKVEESCSSAIESSLPPTQSIESSSPQTQSIESSSPQTQSSESSSPQTQSSEGITLYSRAVADTRQSAEQRGEGCGMWSAQSPDSCTEFFIVRTAQPSKSATDFVINIPAKFATKRFPSTKILAHFSVLLSARGNPWLVSGSSQSRSKSVSAEGHIVMLAIQFTYCGFIGFGDRGGRGQIRWEDCGPLFLFATAIGYSDLAEFLVRSLDPASTWQEKASAAMLASMHPTLSGEAHEVLDVEDMCRRYRASGSKEDASLIVSCLEGIPLSSAEKMMPPDLDHVIRSQFLELWTASNHSRLRETHNRTIKEEIAGLVTNLQLPMEYVRTMLESNSNLVSVFAGTPAGDAFLQNQFKSLQLHDGTLQVQGVSYDQWGPIPNFHFTGVPSEALHQWPGGRFIAGRGCALVSCRSFARMAFRMRSGEAEMKMNFSDLNVWSYSCDAYIIPVWGEHGLSGGEDCRMVYALIRDDPLEMLARDVEEEQDSLFDTQVCMVVSDSRGASSDGGDVVDSFQMLNSEDLAEGMMWDGLYMEGKCLIGWAPFHSSICSGTCYPGTTGSLYVLPASSTCPRVTRGVCLSRTGCYCTVKGVDGTPWVLYPEPAGEGVCIKLSCSGIFRYGHSFDRDAVAMCSVASKGEVVVLYQEYVRIYFLSQNAGRPDDHPPLVLSSYTIPMGGCTPATGSPLSVCPFTSDLYVMDETCNVHFLERKDRDRGLTIDKFFEGDETTLTLNPNLDAKWRGFYSSVTSRRGVPNQLPVLAHAEKSPQSSSSSSAQGGVWSWNP